MKTKVACTLVLVAFICLASMGISYATQKYAEFFVLSYWDNDDDGKNAGILTAYVNQTGVLKILISNVYPLYEAYVSFRIDHAGFGEDPDIYLQYIDYDFPSIMDVSVTDNNGDPFPENLLLEPGDSIYGLVTIIIFQEALQDHTYEFDVRFHFEKDPL